MYLCKHVFMYICMYICRIVNVCMLVCVLLPLFGGNLMGSNVVSEHLVKKQQYFPNQFSHAAGY